MRYRKDLESFENNKPTSIIDGKRKNMNRQPEQPFSNGTGRNSSSSNLTDSNSQHKNDFFTPGPHDVLCGRGKRIQANPGNILFQKMITEEVERQQNPSSNTTTQRACRVQVAREIVTKVRNQTPPGRFLEFDPTAGEWKDIGDQRACEKARQALRDKACISFIKKKSSESSSEDSGTESSKPDGKPSEKSAPNQKRKIERVVERVSSDSTLKVPRYYQQENSPLQRRCSSAPGYEQRIRLPSYMFAHQNQFPLSPKDGSCGNVEDWDLDMRAIIEDNDLLSVPSTPSNSHHRRESMFSPIVRLDPNDFEPINCYANSPNEKEHTNARRRSIEKVPLQITTNFQNKGLDVPILHHQINRIQRPNFTNDLCEVSQQDCRSLYQDHTPAQDNAPALLYKIPRVFIPHY